MADVIHKVTKKILTSVHTPDYGDDWEKNVPGIRAARSIEQRHRVIENNSIREATTQEKEVIDEARLPVLKAVELRKYFIITSKVLETHINDTNSNLDVPSMIDNLRSHISALKNCTTVAQLAALEK